MMQRILNSKNFVACLLTAPPGMVLYFKLPFPGDNVFLSRIALRVPLVQQGLFYSHNLFLFTTPHIAYSTLLSGPHVFGLTVHQRIRTGKLTPYPHLSKRNDLFLVVGAIHNKRQPEPSETPHSLTLPEEVLFTGTAIVGAIGSGKTSCCMYPFADRRGRAEDYIEIGLGAEYRYNPLPNDLDAYGLAYNISLPEQSSPWEALWLVATIQKKSSAGLRTIVRGETLKLCTMKRPKPFCNEVRASLVASLNELSQDPIKMP